MSTRLVASLGDITREDVDVTVNAANRALARGAGVCGAIFAAAGPELDPACAALGGCETGDAKATPGFGMPARVGIHTGGAVWHGGNDCEAHAPAACDRPCIDVPTQLGARSIAFPAISTGIYGFPKRPAAQIAVATLRAVETDAVDLARLVAFDTETYDLYCEALASS